MGGSLASLFTTVALSRLPARHKITILERTPHPLLHSTGAGIVAGAQTLEWFNKYDDSPRSKPTGISITSQERLYLDKEGTVIDQEKTVQRMTSWEMIYYLGRWNVDGMMSKYVDKDGNPEVPKGQGTAAREEGRVEYRYGCTVTMIEEVGGKVKVKYDRVTGSEGESKEEYLQADFLIVADGPSSKCRKILLGEKAKEREYAGYVAFRGTANERELSPAARDVFVEKFTFFHGIDPKTQILAYTIPGHDGTVEQDQRFVNWVWYWNIAKGSQEFKDLMTDTSGKTHRLTLPTGGKMRTEVWQKQKELARENLPPQFLEVIEKTEKPFVQAITDLEPPDEGFEMSGLLNGKAVIIGDALSGFRAHTAASTSQAAFHALLLDKVFRREISWAEYGEQVLEFAWSWQRRGVMLGQRSQFGIHPLAR